VTGTADATNIGRALCDSGWRRYRTVSAAAEGGALASFWRLGMAPPLRRLGLEGPAAIWLVAPATMLIVVPAGLLRTLPCFCFNGASGKGPWQ
jgi:hypothetical protein